MKTLIVDDEPLARRRIRLLLEREADIEILADCGDGCEAVRAIEAQVPDLVFLDIQMPELDGFEVIRSIGVDRFPRVIFVTGYDQYAIRAFEVHACDYLVKPFTDERFAEALAQARSRLGSEGVAGLTERLSELLERIPASRALTRLALRAHGSIRFLDVDEIDWIEAAGKTVRVHAGGEVYELRESIGRLEDKLDPWRFLRIHRSAIVHVDRIAAIEGTAESGQTVALKDGTLLPLSRANRLKVFDLALPVRD
jgi:two-component system LytT family response regulator